MSGAEGPREDPQRGSPERIPREDPQRGLRLFIPLCDWKLGFVTAQQGCPGARAVSITATSPLWRARYVR